MARRILITGGAGFLGGHLSEVMREAGAKVRVLDAVAGPGPEGVERMVGDVRDRAAVERAVAQADVVVHAAFAPPTRSRRELWSVNVQGTANVLDLAHAAGAGRVIVVSSTIVDRRPRPHPLWANAPLSRLDAYRASRVLAETLARRAGERGLSVVVLRPKTLLGPRRVGAFGLIFEWIRRGQAVPLLGAGANRYQLLDVRDLAEAIRRLAGCDATGVFGVGAVEFGTVREDLRALLAHAGTGARLRHLPASAMRAVLATVELVGLPPFSEWHVMCAQRRDSVVDVTGLQRALGWSPSRSNVEALTAAYDSYAASMSAGGVLPTTHPLPLAHRVLGALTRMLPR